jgi:hypothetical protein
MLFGNPSTVALKEYLLLMIAVLGTQILVFTLTYFALSQGQTKLSLKLPKFIVQWLTPSLFAIRWMTFCII